MAILLGDVRRASATEEELLNAPMSVFGGSKDNNYDIITHSNDQPSLGRWFGGSLGLFHFYFSSGNGGGNVLERRALYRSRLSLAQRWLVGEV